MGGIGIWCMHFIGNRAIVLGNGEEDIQILYNVAFTGTSFVLPVVVLLDGILLRRRRTESRLHSHRNRRHINRKLSLRNALCWTIRYLQLQMLVPCRQCRGFGYYRCFLEYCGVGYLLPMESDVDRYLVEACYLCLLCLPVLCRVCIGLLLLGRFIVKEMNL